MSRSVPKAVNNYFIFSVIAFYAIYAISGTAINFTVSMVAKSYKKLTRVLQTALPTFFFAARVWMVSAFEAMSIWMLFGNRTRVVDGSAQYYVFTLFITAVSAHIMAEGSRLGIAAWSDDEMD